MILVLLSTLEMKHYCAKPSAQLPKHNKSLQDDIKHTVKKPETWINTSLNWSNHKNVHCMRLCNVQMLIAPRAPCICWLDKSRADIMKR